MLRTAAISLVLAGVIPGAWAQAVISAHSGMVNFVDGQVRLADQPVKLDGAIFPEVKVGQSLSTLAGHAEILLTPGVFLRLDRHASFRMISNQLTDTRVEILSGSALVEADEILKGNHIVVKMGDAETVLLKTGLYHFNAEAGEVRTFAGKAQVSGASNSDNATELKGGRALLVGSALVPDKFNKNKSKDELYAWSAQRDYRLALANISAARGISAKSFTGSQWAWDPWFSTFTFLPRSGYLMSPFGIDWYSPSTVWVVLQSVPGYAPGYPQNSSGNTSASNSAQSYSRQDVSRSSPSSLLGPSPSPGTATSMPSSSAAGAGLAAHSASRR